MGYYAGELFLIFIVTFLIGSIPFGLIVSRVFYKTDIRAHGSGNIGTTNAIRAMGKRGGILVFLLDFGKGMLSGFMGIWILELFVAIGMGTTEAFGSFLTQIDPFRLGPLGDSSYQMPELIAWVLAVSFTGCVLGHIFSPWLKGKGGKGIAVAVGCVFVAFGVIGAVLELAIFTVLVLTTRYVSVGSIAAALACPFFALYFFWGNWPAIIMCSIGALTIVWAHRENIKRLRAGTENRVGSKKRS